MAILQLERVGGSTTFGLEEEFSESEICNARVVIIEEVPPLVPHPGRLLVVASIVRVVDLKSFRTETFDFTASTDLNRG
jgi:hypothetical protein